MEDFEINIFPSPSLPVKRPDANQRYLDAFFIPNQHNPIDSSLNEASLSSVLGRLVATGRLAKTGWGVSNETGAFPPGTSPETFYKRPQSKSINKLISEVFFKSGLMEAWGRGIPDIFDLCKENDLPKPEFELANGYVYLTIRFAKPLTPRLSGDTDNVTDNVTDELTDSIYDFCLHEIRCKQFA